jgi:hypothetical protein
MDDLLDRLKRLNDFAERQPRWRGYAAAALLMVVVGTATGHSFGTNFGNAVVLVIVFGVVDTVYWVGRRRQTRDAHVPARESARSPRP